jgi:hypothetical protein
MNRHAGGSVMRMKAIRMKPTASDAVWAGDRLAIRAMSYCLAWPGISTASEMRSTWTDDPPNSATRSICLPDPDGNERGGGPPRVQQIDFGIGCRFACGRFDTWV